MHRALDGGAHDLALAHCIVAVAEGQQREQRQNPRHARREGSPHYFIRRYEYDDRRHDRDHRGFADRHPAVNRGIYILRLLNSSRWFSHQAFRLQFNRCHQTQSIMLRAVNYGKVAGYIPLSDDDR